MSTPTAVPEIEDLQARYEQADAEYDRLFDADTTTGADMRVAGQRLGQAWEEYAQACRNAGICVRPGCWTPISEGFGPPKLRRLCDTHRSGR